MRVKNCKLLLLAPVCWLNASALPRRWISAVDIVNIIRTLTCSCRDGYDFLSEMGNKPINLLLEFVISTKKTYDVDRVNCSYETLTLMLIVCDLSKCVMSNDLD